MGQAIKPYLKNPYIHTYTHTYIYTYIHTYIHTGTDNIQEDVTPINIYTDGSK